MTTEAQTKQTIDALIRAQCPLIAVTSREEQRVLAALGEIAAWPRQRSADGKPKPIVEWSASFGFEGGATTENGGQADLPSALKNKRDPMQALEAILAHDEDRFIYVLKDFHPFFQNARVVRLLKDIAQTLVNRPQSVILLSPAFRLPPEIENSISLVDYPMPDLDDLRGVLGRLEEDLGDKIRFDFNTSQDRDQLGRALQGLTLIEAMTVLKQAIIAKDGVLNVEAIGVVLDEKKRIVNRSGVLEYWNATASYDDVGGLDNLKAYLQEAELSLTDEAAVFGLEPVRGVLVGGIPGTGKSLVAKACAGGRHPRPLLKLSISEVMAAGGGIVGQGQARLQQALKVIDSVAPCVVWIDEVDKMFGGQGELDGGTRQDMLADLLTWMQETPAPIFIVATANDVERLPVEFVRRFDERFFVDLPGPAARVEIFEVHLRKRNRQSELVDLDSLVRATAGFTGSEIENAVKGGLRKAFIRVQANGKEGDVTTGDILAAASEIKPISKTMASQIDAYRRWDARRAAGEDPEINIQKQVMLEL